MGIVIFLVIVFLVVFVLRYVLREKSSINKHKKIKTIRPKNREKKKRKIHLKVISNFGQHMKNK